MRNTGLDEETQAGIKIAGRNVNNLRYANDTTPMAESQEELKSLLKKVKDESKKVGLKLSIHETKITASGPITSWQIDEETVETFPLWEWKSERLYFFGFQKQLNNNFKEYKVHLIYATDHSALVYIFSLFLCYLS